MSEAKIDGRRATKIVQQYFMEQYGAFGVNLFEVQNVNYNENDESWTVECSFYRTMLTQEKSFYSVVVHSDGTIGPVRKIEGSSR